MNVLYDFHGLITRGWDFVRQNMAKLYDVLVSSSPLTLIDSLYCNWVPFSARRCRVNFHMFVNFYEVHIYLSCISRTVYVVRSRSHVFCLVS